MPQEILKEFLDGIKPSPCDKCGDQLHFEDKEENLCTSGRSNKCVKADAFVFCNCTIQ